MSRRPASGHHRGDRGRREAGRAEGRTVSAARADIDGEAGRVTAAYRAYVDHLMDCEACAGLGDRCIEGAELWAAYGHARRIELPPAANGGL